MEMIQEMFYPSSSKNRVNVPIEEDFDIDKVFDYTPEQRMKAEKIVLHAVGYWLHTMEPIPDRALRSVRNLMEHNIGSTLFKANIRAFFTIATGI
jgi:hypothetical protein